MTRNKTWMGRPIEELDRRELAGALQAATVRFGPDRLDVEVPRRLQIEQVIALQEWLDSSAKRST